MGVRQDGVLIRARGKEKEKEEGEEEEKEEEEEEGEEEKEEEEKVARKGLFIRGERKTYRTAEDQEWIQKRLGDAVSKLWLLLRRLYRFHGIFDFWTCSIECIHLTASRPFV